MATCHLCPSDDNEIADTEVLDHLRVMHPDQYRDGPDRWPDGEVVVNDLTLSPDDFTGGR